MLTDSVSTLWLVKRFSKSAHKKVKKVKAKKKKIKLKNNF